MVTITISGEQPVSVNWSSRMNAQQVLEEAYSNITFAAKYYGSSLGYMVVMINGVYDDPSYRMYCEFFYNGNSSNYGIDSTILNDGDSISFKNVLYREETHKGTLLEQKHHKATLYKGH